MRQLLLPALLAATMVAPAVAATESYVVYDTFYNTTPIDTTRWLQPELDREISAGRLLMRQRSLGQQFGNTGTNDVNHTTSLQNPNAITRLRANVIVSAASVTGCAANTTPSEVRARIIGSYFNTGTPLGATDRTNDVGAQIRMVLDSNNVDGLLKVQGVVFRCTDADCNTSALIGTVKDLGTAAIGANLRLQIDWDKAGKTFIFYRDTNPGQSVSYTESDSTLPVLPYKQMATRTQMANCLSGARTVGDIEARFDNVMVNTSALP